MSTVIKIENVSKQYRLGSIGTSTLRGDQQRWWYSVRGLPDPTLMIGQENNLNNKVKAEVKVKVELNRRGLSKEKYKLYLCKYLC